MNKKKIMLQFVNWKSQSSQQMEKLNENIMKQKYLL